MSVGIGMHGAAGRMGRSIISVIAGDDGAALAAAVDRESHPGQGTDAGVLAGSATPLGVALSHDLLAAVAASDVVVDFSRPEGMASVLQACRAARTPAVVGTTGAGKAGEQALAAAAEVVPVVFAPNFSVGVNVFWALAQRAVQLLGEEYDIEIVEMHHRHKVDAPSGTAVRLTEVVADARGLPLEAVVPGRTGITGARSRNEIGVHALRGGDVVGEHSLILAGPGERVELSHRAHTREIFARGAVRAAKWAATQPPGLYGMVDVLAI